MSTTPAPEQHHYARSEMVPMRLRAALAAKDISVNQASRILGWTQSNFQRQTKGQVRLRLEQLEWIEARLGITLEYLLGFTDELPTFGRRPLRPVGKTQADPAGVLFNDGTGDLEATGSESFLSESNRRPFHYKRHGQVIQFPFRPNKTPQSCPAGQVAKVIPFPA